MCQMAMRPIPTYYLLMMLQFVIILEEGVTLFFFKLANPGFFLFIFGLFKQTILQQINAK